MSLQADWRRTLNGSRMPLTWTLIALTVLTGLLSTAQLPIMQALAFAPQQWWRAPWTLFTWAILGDSRPLGLLFEAGLIYLFAGSVERAWGTSLYARFLAATVALTALTFWLGATLLGFPYYLPAGALVALGASMVAWSSFNRQETILFFFLPIPGWLFGPLGFLMAWAYSGGGLMGLFALSGCAAAYWYAHYGRSWGGPRARRGGRPSLRVVEGQRKPQNPLQRALEEKRRRERDRKLEEMFRRSGYTDDE